MATTGLEDLDNEPLNEERIRRMKGLMRQLYKEEVESKRLRLPQIKAGAVFIFVAFGVILLLASTTLYNYNMFVTLRERVQSARGHVETALQRRSNLFANLVNLTLNHAELEREVFRHVADVRQDLNKPGGGGPTTELASPGKTMDANALLAAASSGNLSRMMAVVEQYPNIKSSTTYKDLIASLLEIEEQIVINRIETDTEVKGYNTLISSFPWYLLARYTGFGYEKYFRVGSGEDGIPSLKTDFFNRLLPYGEPGLSKKEPSLPTAPTKGQ
ncbi:MAG: LemA family protein [Magnetococcales bacterium]|nr:LemA family protein [Magnetococcales bacterium]MBF0439030.1 LemA family protein [Magnetococcales bacterium]